MPRVRRTRRALLALAALALGACGNGPSGITVAVATNFLVPAEGLAARFEAEEGIPVTLVGGSTGQLYAQAVAGAPFDLFLAADEVRPARLVEAGVAVEGSAFVYATGRLCLWTPDETVSPAELERILRAGDFERMAIANPELAPYGAAARDALRALGLWDGYRNRIVLGENVGQAYAQVATGNAELGFVALAQVSADGRSPAGSCWLVPAHLHAPIRQAAVLLGRAADNSAALAFLDFLRSPAARETISAAGYEAG